MFLYYLPDCLTVDLDALRAAGLGYAFDSPTITQGRCPRKGPDGGEGMLLSACEQRLAYLPGDEQRWRKVPGSSAWVGYWTAQPPSPRDLLRPGALPGRSVELGDGQEWLIPILRTWHSEEDAAGWICDLPTVAGVDDAGNWTTDRIVPRYADLYRQALRYFDLKCGAATQAASEAQEDKPGRASMTFAELYDVALALLATNYRIGKAEVALLRLFSSSIAIEILDTAVDWPTLEAWLEKKTPLIPDSSPTGAGPAASPPDTGPPLES